MNLSRVAFVPLLLLGLACGGKSKNLAPAEDGGAEASRSDGGEEASAPDGGVCIVLQPTTGDLACKADGDCAFAITGRVCPGDCCGGGSAVNTAAAARLAHAAAAVAQASQCSGVACGAPFGQPRCIQGSCAACDTSSAGTSCLSAVGDAGVVTFAGDAGDGRDVTGSRDAS